VRLGCREEPGVTICDISDDGVGISPDQLERIFTPFFTTREKGTGLGLAFAKKIVDEHGGELTVRSVQGEGSTFSIALPRKQDHGDDSDHR
jgi:signal transduction histidine kinase